jgi:hypothetical protein
MSRALRRHHTARLKSNRRQWWGQTLDKKQLGKVVDTPTPCSCSMCANRRHLEGETIQERKHHA